MDVNVGRTSCSYTTTITTITNTNTTDVNGAVALPLLQQRSDGDLLACLNDEKALLYLPVIVFLGVLQVTGTLGNILVLCVYWRKAYKASSHYFILSLAALDLFSCVVGLPTEMADLRFPYLFDLPVACKLLRFTHSSTIIASSCILIQVAFDRYYRICKLGQQFSVRKAKALCLMSLVLGVLTSWPSCLLFGRKTLKLHLQPDPQQRYSGQSSLPLGDASTLLRPRQRVLMASDCSTEDSMRGTIYPAVYILFLFSLFFLTVAFFAILYIRIGVAIWRRKRKTIGAKVFIKVNSQGSDHTSTDLSSETAEPDPHRSPHRHPPPTPYLTPTLICSNNISGKKQKGPDATQPELTHYHYRYNKNHPDHPPPTHYLTGGTLTRGSGKKKSDGGGGGGGGAGERPEMTYHQKQLQQQQQNQGKRRQLRVGKTTTVLFAVTLAYILSFLPYLVVMVLRSVLPGFESRLSPVGEVAYKFCVKSFFINNAINPLIYSFLNAGFRKDAHKTLRKLWHNCVCRCLCCCCCRDRRLDHVLPNQPPIAV